jgi:hypothetical protein
MRAVEFARRVWAAPCTALGLLIGAWPLALGGRIARCDGAIEITYRERLAACGRVARALPFRGIVFGHVILAVTGEEIARIRAHERVHVEQYERWGPLFFVAYGASGLWQLLRGRSSYWDNAFEVQARRLGAASDPPLFAATSNRHS